MNMAVEVSDEVIEERIMLCMLLLMRIDGFFRCCCCVDRSKKFSHASVLMETHVMFDRSFFALLLPEPVTCFERKMCSVLNRLHWLIQYVLLRKMIGFRGGCVFCNFIGQLRCWCNSANDCLSFRTRDYTRMNSINSLFFPVLSDVIIVIEKY